MKPVNKGIIRKMGAVDVYHKVCSFDDAVLWKIRSISVPPQIVEILKKREVYGLVFDDLDRNERLVIKLTEFVEHAVLQQQFQEQQYYCNVSYFQSRPIKKDQEIRSIL